MRVAALDDDAVQLELIARTIAGMGHDCLRFKDSASFLQALRGERFDLLIFDVHVAGYGGLELLRVARGSVTEHVPVLVITDGSAEADLIESLDGDANDFLVAPVRTNELTARVKALLRRSLQRQEPVELVFGPFRFDVAGGRVIRDGHPVTLKRREFDLALFLFRNLGRRLSRKRLLEAVWGVDGEEPSRSLDTHASRLRNKLGLNPASGFRLASIYSVGYRLEQLAPGAAGAAPGA